MKFHFSLVRLLENHQRYFVSLFVVVRCRRCCKFSYPCWLKIFTRPPNLWIAHQIYDIFFSTRHTISMTWFPQFICVWTEWSAFVSFCRTILDYFFVCFCIKMLLSLCQRTPLLVYIAAYWLFAATSRFSKFRREFRM